MERGDARRGPGLCVGLLGVISKAMATGEEATRRFGIYLHSRVELLDAVGDLRQLQPGRGGRGCRQRSGRNELCQVEESKSSLQRGEHPVAAPGCSSPPAGSLRGPHWLAAWQGTIFIVRPGSSISIKYQI